MGLVGAGHLGRIHLKVLSEMTDTHRLVGVYDTDPQARSSAERDFGVKAYEDLDTLLEDIDALTIVTPTVHHFEVAKRALEAGRHLFIEKPITQTLFEGRELLELSKSRGLKVQVGHVERYNPAYRAIRDRIHAPKFIETHRLAPFNPRGTDVPVVLDLMIHDLDIILEAVKSPVAKISASGVAVVADTPDIANARLEFENGAVANLTTSRISMKAMRKMRFFQPNAYLSVDFLDKKVETFQLEELGEHDPDPFDVVLEVPNMPTKRVIADAPDVPPLNAIREEHLALHACLTRDEKLEVDAEAGFRALELAHRILDSIQQNATLVERNI